jgi:hypothetical protein
MSSDAAELAFVATMRDEATAVARQARRSLDSIGGPTKPITTDLRVDASGAKEAAAEAKRVADSIPPEFEAAGDEAGEGLVSGIVGKVKGAKGGIVGAIAALGIGSALTSALGIDRANDKLAAELGATPATAAKYGKLAGEIYAGAWGDSVEDVNDAIASVKSSIRGLGTGDALKAATTQALDFATIFEIDVARAAQVAGQAIRTGLAKDATEAFDLLTAASQQVPKNLREDVLDAADEYGQFFASLGYDGTKAFGVLAAGAQKGMYGIDKAGDAVKEFTIRATDMSTASVGAYEAIGLDAGRMADEILAGGDRAQEATGKIIDGLLSIESPSKRANTAIALFGTPLEDLNVRDIPAFLRSLKGLDGGLGRVAGASKRAGDTLNDNASTNLTSFARQAKLLAVNALGGSLIPAVSKGAKFLASNFGPAVDDVVTSAKDLASSAAPAVKGFFDSLKGGGGSGGGALAETGRAIGEFVGGLLPTLKSIGSSISSTLGPGLREIGNLVRTQLLPAFQGILPVVLPIAKFLLGVFGSALVGALRGVINVVKGVVKVIAGVLNVVSGLLTGDWSRAWKGAQQIVAGVVRAVWGVIEFLWNVGILSIFRKGAAKLLGSWRGLWNGVKGLASKAMGLVRGVVSGGLSIVRKIFGKAIGAVRSIVGKGFGLVATVIRTYVKVYATVIRAAWSLISKVVGGAIGLVKGIVSKGFGAVRTAISGAMTKAKSVVSSAATGIKSAFSKGVAKVVSEARALPGKIVSALGNLGSLLKDAGSKIIGGLIDGITGSVGALKDKLGSVTKLIPDWKGPAKRDAKLLVPAGRLIMRGLVDGLSKGVPNVEKMLGTLTREIAAYWRKHAASAKAAKARTRATLRDLRDEYAALRRNASMRTKLVAKIADARKYADDLTRAARDASAVTSVESVNEAPLTAGFLVQGLKDKLAKINAFRADLENLRDRGLSAGALREIEAAGYEQGSAYADALANGTADQIRQVNAAQAQIRKSTEKLGNESVAGIIAGIRSQIGRVDVIGTRLAAALRRAIRRELGIKSPSRVLAADMRVGVGGGVARGLLASIPEAERSAAAIAQAVRNAAVPTISDLAAIEARSHRLAPVARPEEVLVIRHEVTSPDGSVAKLTAEQIADMIARNPRAAGAIERALKPLRARKVKNQIRASS